MKYLIKFIAGVFCFFCFTGNKLIAQQKIDSSFHFYYYDQKLSMFDAMDAENDGIVWLGDSITDGGEWSELFKKKKTANRGISSDVTYGVLNRLYNIKKLKPSKVFVLIGINDVARNIPDSLIIKNYLRIIDTFLLQMPNTKLYMQSLLPTNNSFTNFKNHQNKTDHIQFINAALKKVCQNKKVTFVNLYDEFLDKEGKLDAKYTNDGLHLIGAGYIHWKNFLLKNKYL
jgi:lysophospholipase L1-like esterase